MRHFIVIVSIFLSTICFCQTKNIVGIFGNGIVFPKFSVTFNNDSTFNYASSMHPTFHRYESFSEKGRWALSGDTIILNPQLPKKIYTESDFIEQEKQGNKNFMLTFNHIKRYFDNNNNNNIIKTDTVQFGQLDYSFNALKKKKLTRVAPRLTTRCAFAGYIPKEVVTADRTIYIQRPAEKIKSIFIGCYELQGTKEFIIKNQNSNHLTFNVYSNYYGDGQIRQMKFLIKNEKTLYTGQKENGQFEKKHLG